MKKILFICTMGLLCHFTAVAQKTKKSLSGSTADSAQVAPNQQVDFGGMMNSMAPMFGMMIKSMMDAQMTYYQQPGKLEEVAKLTRQYFTALIKEGFSEEQALRIVVADGILPKANMSSK